jgi:hypothetical protein
MNNWITSKYPHGPRFIGVESVARGALVPGSFSL